MFNTWQKAQLKKFNLKETDIKEIKTPYITIHDKKNHNEFAEFKHYPCKCGQYTLLGLIETLEGKCKDCFGFNK